MQLAGMRRGATLHASARTHTCSTWRACSKDGSSAADTASMVHMNTGSCRGRAWEVRSARQNGTGFTLEHMAAQTQVARFPPAQLRAYRDCEARQLVLGALVHECVACARGLEPHRRRDVSRRALVNLLKAIGRDLRSRSHGRKSAEIQMSMKLLVLSDRQNSCSDALIRPQPGLQHNPQGWGLRCGAVFRVETPQANHSQCTTNLQKLADSLFGVAGAVADTHARPQCPRVHPDENQRPCGCEAAMSEHHQTEAQPISSIG